MSLPSAQRLAASQPWLDGVSDRLQPIVRTAVARTGRRTADLLDGVWFGAPLHPVAHGRASGGADRRRHTRRVGVATRSKALDRQADGALAVSIAGALAAAATGLSDWRYLRGDTRGWRPCTVC